MPQSYGTSDSSHAPKRSVAALCSLASAFGLVVLSSVTEVLFADSMPRVDKKLPFRADQRKVLTDSHAPMVKQYVVVGTEAQSVVMSVRPVVRCTQRPDVRGLRVGSGEALQSRAAHLAPVVVELLDPSRLLRVPHDAQHGSLSPGRPGRCLRALCARLLLIIFV